MLRPQRLLRVLKGTGWVWEREAEEGASHRAGKKRNGWKAARELAKVGEKLRLQQGTPGPIQKQPALLGGCKSFLPPAQQEMGMSSESACPEGESKEVHPTQLRVIAQINLNAEAVLQKSSPPLSAL